MNGAASDLRTSGLLSNSRGSGDIDVIREICTKLHDNCCEYYSEWGFELKIHSPSVIRCSLDGAELFGEGGAFSKSPGAFKRTAAFVVLARLGRLFQFHNPKGTLTPDQIGYWRARISALLIPLTLVTIETKINGQTTILKDWNGWPSNHYKLEFIAWLKWLDLCNRYADKIGHPDWNTFKAGRLARMTMSCALIIEAAYYLGNSTKNENSIQGRDMGCLENLSQEQVRDLHYDYPIHAVHSPS